MISLLISIGSIKMSQSSNFIDTEASDIQIGSSSEPQDSIDDITEETNTNKHKENSNNNNSKEKSSVNNYRLGGRKPLATILYLSSGPILAQFTGSLKGIIGSIWVSKSIGEKGLATISTIGVFDGISRSFGFFLSSAASAKISQLYGKHQEEEAAQLVVDLVRVAAIMGVVIPLILGLSTIPLARWLGADDEISQMSKEYMLPINVGTFTTCAFIALGGCLQGEGRSLFFSICNVFSLVVNMCVLDPIFLLALKTGIWGASLAQALSEAIPGIVIFTLYFMGKFGVKPKWKMFISKFSPHTFPSLKVGLSQLFANLSQIVPSIVVRKLMGMSFKENYNDAMAAFNTVVRFFVLTNSVIIAVTMGFIPSGSYAFAAKRYRRWFKLAFHSLWISFIWGSFTAILTWTIPRHLARMFASGKGYLDVCEPMLKYSNALGFIICGRFCCVAYLQSFQLGIYSMILSLISHFLSIIGFAFLLYFTNKNDGVRIIWCYSMAHALGLVLGVCFLIWPIKKCYKLLKNEDADDAINNEDVEEMYHSDSIEDDRSFTNKDD